jgi:hypothetical protein
MPRESDCNKNRRPSIREELYEFLQREMASGIFSAVSDHSAVLSKNCSFMFAIANEHEALLDPDKFGQVLTYAEIALSTA